MRTEKVLAIVFILGQILRLFHLPGAGLLTVISMSLLSMLYFPFGFYFCTDKTLKNQNLPISILGGMFLSIGVMGILFKIQRYPGANLMLLIAIPGMIILMILIPALKGGKPEWRKYYRNMFLRSSIIGALSVALYLIPTSELIKFQYRDDPEHARLIIKANEDPDNEQYRKGLEEYESKKYFSIEEDNKEN